jgi:Fe-S-cluster containining protein
MDNQNDFPYYFNSNVCKTCDGRCCRGSRGYVWVSLVELEKMAVTRKMDVALFSKQYVRHVQGRLSLKERVINGEHFCCFFDPIDCQCTIYQSRPKQCRTFPFWDQFKKAPQELLDECPGVSLKRDVTSKTT